MTGVSDALWRAIPLLRCPQCSEPVEAGASVTAGLSPPTGSTSTDGAPITGVRCTAGHAFDRARQGYLTLFGPRGRRFPGDTTEQVLARDRVLRSGVFDPVAAVLARIACAETEKTVRTGGCSGPVVLEAGAGTGFYLRHVLEGLRAACVTGRGVGAAPLGLGSEISVAAARRLARADPDLVALVADTWDGLPLAEDSVDLLQVVFAPRNAAEFARVLRPGGSLVVAGPGPGHLEPLRSDVGMLTPDADKAERLEAGLAGFFSPGRVRVVDETVQVPGTVSVDLALMGPSGVHLDRDDLERTLGARESEVRIHVEIRTFHPVK